MTGVSRRLVLYVHGFDPRGPGPFHAMQVQAAARDSLRPGRRVTVGPRRRGSGSVDWTVEAEWPEGPVATTFSFLRWDDLVRARWDKTLWVQARNLFTWQAGFWRAGFVGDSLKTSRTQTLAFFALPATALAFCLVLLAVTGLLGAGIGWAAGRAGLSPWLGASAALLLLAGPWLWRRVDDVANVCWLGRGYLYMTDLSRDRVQGLDARTDAFARRILDEAADPRWDEIVVVGHSSGSINGVLALGRALAERPDLGRSGPRVALITVGHCIPGYSIQGLRPAHVADLDWLVQARWIPWSDISSPADPGGSAWHPLRHSPHAADLKRVACRSPRFSKAMSKADYRRLRRNPMAFHFQYMQATDDPAIHDWFRLIAGPERLAP